MMDNLPSRHESKHHKGIPEAIVILETGTCRVVAFLGEAEDLH